MSGFRPTFWPTLFTVPVLAALIGLGIWQLQRLEWKDAEIAERRARGGAPPVSLPARQLEEAWPADALDPFAVTLHDRSGFADHARQIGGDCCILRAFSTASTQD